MFRAFFRRLREIHLKRQNFLTTANKKSHNFFTSLSHGKVGEVRLDAFFMAQGYQIATVPLADELARGIDRILTNPDSITFSVEYKTDGRAAKTGNIFIEFLSNDTKNSPGWILKSQAQILVYFVEPSSIYIAEMPAIKRQFAKWKKEFRAAKAPNIKNGLLIYSSHGVLVPIKEFEKHCLRVLNLNSCGVF